MEINKIYLGDCLEVMKEIPDKSIDCIICDLPYGISACDWDIIIPFDKLWEQYKRIIKQYGNIVLFGREPFSSYLRLSNIEDWKYDCIWEKSKGIFFHAKNMPIMFHENISVFSNGKIGHEIQLGEKRMCYNPQGLIKVDKIWHRAKLNNSEHKYYRKSHKSTKIIEFTNYPKSILKFSNSSLKQRNLHPTQKPVELIEYLIKTYSNENDIILDNCAGSGTTGIACINTNRNYILIEKEERYYQVAIKRLEEVMK